LAAIARKSNSPAPVPAAHFGQPSKLFIFFLYFNNIENYKPYLQRYMHAYGSDKFVIQSCTAIMTWIEGVGSVHCRVATAYT
jgi:hypothetical protein